MLKVYHILQKLLVGNIDIIVLRVNKAKHIIDIYSWVLFTKCQRFRLLAREIFH